MSTDNGIFFSLKAIELQTYGFQLMIQGDHLWILFIGQLIKLLNINQLSFCRQLLQIVQIRHIKVDG